MFMYIGVFFALKLQLWKNRMVQTVNLATSCFKGVNTAACLLQKIIFTFYSSAVFFSILDIIFYKSALKKRWSYSVTKSNKFVSYEPNFSENSKKLKLTKN